jgi:hypothetical protein
MTRGPAAFQAAMEPFDTQTIVIGFLENFIY